MSIELVAVTQTDLWQGIFNEANIFFTFLEPKKILGRINPAELEINFLRKLIYI